MNIALLSLNYLPSTGGLVSYLNNMAVELIQQGHSVTIICAKERGDNSPEVESIDGIKIYRFEGLNGGWVSKLFTPYYISSKLKKEIKNNFQLNEFDLIIARHVYLAHALLGAVNESKTLFLTPLISPKLVMINAASEPLIRKFYSWWLIPQLYCLERKVMSSNIHLGVLSKSKQTEVAEYYQIPKPKVFPPGVDTKRFYSKNNFQYEKVLFVSVCRLVEEKNLSLVLKSLAILKEQKANFSFNYTIVGDGPLRGSLENQASKLGLTKDVTFTGYVNNPEDYYRDADLFILPSSYEGFGHVYLEANACGIPCLGLSNTIEGVITASEEIIDEGINGFIIRDNTIDEMCIAINRYLESGYNKTEWRKKCAEYVTEKYSWATHFKEIVSDVK